MTTDTAVNCHERGLGRNHKWEDGGVCARCGASRDTQIAAALASGMRGGEVAEEFGVSPRSVFRAAERVRKGVKPRTATTRVRRDTNATPAVMRAVVAALEAGCPRCGGTVLPERDEDGELDPQCVACSHRVRSLLPEQAEALRREIDERETRMNSLGHRSNGPRRRGQRL